MTGYSWWCGSTEKAIPELCVFVKPVSAGCLVTFLLVLLTGACCFSITAGSRGGTVALLLACLLYPCTCIGICVLQTDEHVHTGASSLRFQEKRCRVVHAHKIYLITYVPSNKGGKCSLQPLLCTHDCSKKVRVRS